MRNNTSLTLTDLTYQTKSSSRIVHDIETGLNNMGIAFLKVWGCDLSSYESGETGQYHSARVDLIRITVQRTKPRIGTNGWLCHQIDGNHHQPQQQFTTSNLCQHPDRRPVSWIQIFDCFHRRGACSELDKQRYLTLHEPEILEADLCMWSRSLLMEDW